MKIGSYLPFLVQKTYLATQQLAPLATGTVVSFVSDPNVPVERQMITCARKGTFKPNPKYALTALHFSLDEPKNLKEALESPSSVEAMHVGLQALENNNRWELVPRTPNMNVLRSKWVHKTKLKFDVSTDRFKTTMLPKITLKFLELILMKLFLLLFNLLLFVLYCLLFLPTNEKSST